MVHREDRHHGEESSWSDDQVDASEESSWEDDEFRTLDAVKRAEIYRNNEANY